MVVTTRWQHAVPCVPVAQDLRGPRWCLVPRRLGGGHPFLAVPSLPRRGGRCPSDPTSLGCHRPPARWAASTWRNLTGAGDIRLNGPSWAALLDQIPAGDRPTDRRSTHLSAGHEQCGSVGGVKRVRMMRPGLKSAPRVRGLWRAGPADARDSRNPPPPAVAYCVAPCIVCGRPRSGRCISRQSGPARCLLAAGPDPNRLLNR